jgi:hypothetical protein
VLAGDRVQSRRTVLRLLPETVRADVCEQIRGGRLPTGVTPFARLMRALEVLP